MSRLKQLIQELCPNGVEYKELKTVATIKARIGWQGLTKKEYLDKGNYYLVTGVDFKKGDIDWENCHYITKERYIQDINIQLKNNDVLVTKDGTLGKIAYVKNMNKPATLNSGIFVIRSLTQGIESRYLYHYLNSSYLMKFANSQLTGGTIKHLNQSVITQLPVPCPPLEVQREIVRILDNFTKLTTELTTELTLRKKQYIYYALKLLSQGKEKFPVMELGKISNFSYGYTDKASDNGNVRFIRITDIMDNGCLNPENAKYITLTADSEKYLLKKGDIVMARTGATYGKTLYILDDTPAVYASFLIKITLDNTKVLNRFFWHYAQTPLYWSQANKLVSGGGQPQFNARAISRIKVPIPSLEVQKGIIEVLDNFNSICTNLSSGLPSEIEARQKQYEYYRDKLLDFRELKR